MNTLRKAGLAMALGATLALTGCWGGEDNNIAAPPVTTTPTTPVNSPPSAINDTVTNFIGYLLVLVGQTSDGEPLDVASVSPPVSDTTEPTALP